MAGSGKAQHGAESSPPRPPAALVVAHTSYTVTLDEAECEQQNADGLTWYGQRRIVLRPGMALDREREVMLHEALHACVGAARGHGLSDAAEERAVDALTGPILDLFRRNPKLREYLCGD